MSRPNTPRNFNVQQTELFVTRIRVVHTQGQLYMVYILQIQLLGKNVPVIPAGDAQTVLFCQLGANVVALSVVLLSVITPN